VFRTYVNRFWSARKQKKNMGSSTVRPLWSHVLVPLLCSKFLIKSAPGQEKPLSGSIVDVLATGSQRKQKHKTTCCGSNLLCFTRSNTRVCFASLQESRSGWFGAPPSRTRKYLMGDHILSILFLGAFEKLQKATFSFVIFLCLSWNAPGTTRLPLDGFSRTLMFERLSQNLSSKHKV
jgi:hypothetical protein